GWLVGRNLGLRLGIAGELDGLRDLTVPKALLILHVVAVQNADVAGQDVESVALLTVTGPHHEDPEQRHVVLMAEVVDGIQVVDELDVVPVTGVEVRVERARHFSVGDGLTWRVTRKSDQEVEQFLLGGREDGAGHVRASSRAVHILGVSSAHSTSSYG